MKKSLLLFFEMKNIILIKDELNFWISQKLSLLILEKISFEFLSKFIKKKSG